MTDRKSPPCCPLCGAVSKSASNSAYYRANAETLRAKRRARYRAKVTGKEQAPA